MLEFFESHKGWLMTIAGVIATMFAPKLGLDADQTKEVLIGVGGLVGSYVVSHNVKKGMIGAAEAKSAGLVARVAQPALPVVDGAAAAALGPQ